MRNETHRHSRFLSVPGIDTSKTQKRTFVSLLHSRLQGCPFIVIDCFNKPAIFPVDAFRAAANKFAKSIEIKLCMLGLSRYRGFAKFAGHLIGTQFCQSVKKSDPAVEESARQSFG